MYGKILHTNKRSVKFILHIQQTVYFCGMEKQTVKTQRHQKAWALWDHFAQYVWPLVRKGQPRQVLNRVNVAKRDRHGKTLRKDGQPVYLGTRRVKAILGALAPEVYDLERMEVAITGELELIETKVSSSRTVQHWRAAQPPPAPPDESGKWQLVQVEVSLGRGKTIWIPLEPVDAS